MKPNAIKGVGVKKFRRSEGLESDMCQKMKKALGYKQDTKKKKNETVDSDHRIIQKLELGKMPKLLSLTKLSPFSGEGHMGYINSFFPRLQNRLRKVMVKL